MLRGFGDFDPAAKGCGTSTKDYAATQTALAAVGATDQEGKPISPDGQWGPRSQAAFDKYAAHFTANKTAFAALGIALTACEALRFEALCIAGGNQDPNCGKAPRFGAAASTPASPASESKLPPGAPPPAGPGSQFFEIQNWQKYLNTLGCKVNEEGLWDDATDAASKAVLAGKPCVARKQVAPRARMRPSAIRALRALFAPAAVPAGPGGKPVSPTVSISKDGRVSAPGVTTERSPYVGVPKADAPMTAAAAPAVSPSFLPSEVSVEEDRTTLYIAGGIALVALAAGGIYFATKKKD